MFCACLSGYKDFKNKISKIACQEEIEGPFLQKHKGNLKVRWSTYLLSHSSLDWIFHPWQAQFTYGIKENSEMERNAF